MKHLVLIALLALSLPVLAEDTPSKDECKALKDELRKEHNIGKKACRQLPDRFEQQECLTDLNEQYQEDKDWLNEVCKHAK
jgi:hypothetical protein